MKRSSGAGSKIFIRRFLPAKPICKPSRPLIPPACHVGANGWEKLAQSIQAAKRASVIEPASIKRVIVDAADMAKAIGPSTDLAGTEPHLARYRRPILRPVATPKLQSPGAGAGTSGNAVCPCSSIQAHALCLARVVLKRSARAVRHRTATAARAA